MAIRSFLPRRPDVVVHILYGKNEGRSRGTTKQAHQENTKTRAKNTKKNRSGVGVWGTFMSIGYSGIYLAGEKGGQTL